LEPWRAVEASMNAVLVFIADDHQALQEGVRLKQLIPICCCCRKINTGEEIWQQFQTYIEQQTGSGFSHDLWPQCMEVEIAKLNAGPAS